MSRSQPRCHSRGTGDECAAAGGRAGRQTAGHLGQLGDEQRNIREKDGDSPGRGGQEQQLVLHMGARERAGGWWHSMHNTWTVIMRDTGSLSQAQPPEVQVVSSELVVPRDVTAVAAARARAGENQHSAARM
jgi:hypothetical protein